MGREALRDQPGEDLALHGDGTALFDEVEHRRLEDVAPRIHEMACGLAPRRFLDEPRNPALHDLDGAEVGGIVRGPHCDRPQAAGLAMGLHEGVEVDRVDDVAVVYRERTADVTLHVLQGPAGPERSRLVDDADRDPGFVFPEEVADLFEQVIHGDDRLVARGREGVQDVQDERPVHEGDQGLRTRQREGAQPLAQASGDDHELHPLSDERPRLCIFWPCRFTSGRS